MICPGCQRDNHPRRRYCGRCGCNFDPVCRACAFVNDRDDRYCGGCGVTLAGESASLAVAVPVAVVAASAAPPIATAPAAAPAPAGPVDELAGLFSPRPKTAEISPLPEVGIAQGDLDRLFGGVP